MDTHRLRVKIGPHEFEAEGSEESVIAQFNEFKKLIETVPVPGPSLSLTPTTGSLSTHPHAPTSIEMSRLEPLFSNDERRGLVSLRIIPTGERRDSDATLLVLLGFKLLRNEDVVPVTSLKAALQQSGCEPKRVDRAAEPYRKEGLLLKGGKGKGGKYRITNKGISRAHEIMESMLEQVT